MLLKTNCSTKELYKYVHSLENYIMFMMIVERNKEWRKYATSDKDKKILLGLFSVIPRGLVAPHTSDSVLTP